jgi:uncharacterized protein
MFNKLLLTAVIILVIWYGFKWVGRLDRARKKKTLKGKRAEPEIRPEEAETLVKCPVCGTYVSPGGPEPCGREDCPY